MYDLVIREGTVVSSHGAITTDIGIFGEKIVALGNGLDGKEVVDATGKYVLPGVIDSHVHFSSPCGGATTSDDFYSGSAAGACGGVTTFLASTVGASDRTLGEDLTSRLAEASPSVTDYGFHSEVVGWKNGRGEEISEVMARGVKSFKFYTTYGAAGKKTEPGELFRAFGEISAKNAVALLHCEDDNFIEYFTSGLSRDDWADMNSQARARPPLCEASAVNAVGWLALKTGLRCHMTHLSSQWGLEEAELARKRGAVITVDTCPQYLLLNESAYDGREGQLFSVAPPLRSARDNKALWEGLERGAVDFATTNHCPFTRSQKAWQGTFEGIPRGLPGIETLLSLLFSEGVLRGRLSMNSLVRATSEGPARLFGLYPRKGCLLPGSDADIVVFDPEDQWTIRAGELRMNVDFSPYEGMEIMGRVWKTLSRGEIIYSDGRFLGKRGRGKFLSP